LGTQILGQTFVPSYLSNKATITRTRNILQNHLQELSKNYIRSTRTSKNYRKNPRTRGIIVTRSPKTRRHLGNNSLKTRKKGIEKKNIPIVYSKYNCSCVIGYSLYTRKRSPNKYII
jgi:hypothetical protein